MPTPPAAFSPLTITQCGRSRSRSSGSRVLSVRRPTPPTTSPTNRMLIGASIDGGSSQNLGGRRRGIGRGGWWGRPVGVGGAGRRGLVGPAGGGWGGRGGGWGGAGRGGVGGAGRRGLVGPMTGHALGEVPRAVRLAGGAEPVGRVWCGRRAAGHAFGEVPRAVRLRGGAGPLPAGLGRVDRRQ